MASSVVTTDGSWATLPMGRLSEPSNTFWQLMFRPSGSSSWIDEVTATAVATNGGLTLGTPFGASPPASIAVAIGSSGHLTFSPLLASADAGASWSAGLLPTGLARQPSAFAVEPGAGLALVGGNDPRVLASAGSLSHWRSLASAETLAALPAARSCRLAELTAVGYRGGTPVVGGSCAGAGQVALFLDVGGAWRSAGLQLPAAWNDRRADVLGLESGGAGLSALIELAGRGPADLIAASTAGPGQAWTLSPPWELPPGGHLVSLAAAGPGGLYVLLTARAGALCLAVTAGAGAAWQTMPAPPAGTAVVAAGPGGSITALAAAGTVFTAWNLPAGSSTWAEGQRSVIPIPYGSSG